MPILRASNSRERKKYKGAEPNRKERFYQVGLLCQGCPENILRLARNAMGLQQCLRPAHSGNLINPAVKNHQPIDCSGPAAAACLGGTPGQSDVLH